MSVVHVSWLLLLVVGVAAFGLIGLVKVLASPRSGAVVKVLVAVPFAVLALLFLAFVVLRVSYRVPRVQAHSASAIVAVDAPATEAKVSVSPGGRARSTKWDRYPAKWDRHAPETAKPDQDPSQIAGVLGALNRALVAAARSWVTKSESSDPPPAPAAAPGAASPQSLPAVTASKTPTRPGWVENPPQPSMELYELVVKAGPWKTPLECERELDEKITWAVDSYVAWRIGDEASSQVQLPADYAREHLVKENPWVEKVNTSLGEMYNVYALLQFDRQVEGKLQDLWDQIRLGTRLLLSAAVLAGALLILSVIYGYLKLDLATGGAYRGRLRFVAVVTILALVAAGAVVCR